jgi:hypothetical protein
MIEDGKHLRPSQEQLPDIFLYIGEEHYKVKILRKLLKPQGIPGGEPCKLNNLQPSTEIATNLLVVRLLR